MDFLINSIINMRSSYAKGVCAENMACQFLYKRGYTVWYRRYKTPHGEIDVIITRQDVLAFVEVKHRQSMYSARISITDHQKQRMYNTALFFLQHHPAYRQHATLRFDAVCIQDRHRMVHITNIISY